MRDDMFEVIIDVPRAGGRWTTHARRARRRDAKVDLKRDPDGMLRQLAKRRLSRREISALGLRS